MITYSNPGPPNVLTVTFDDEKTNPGMIMEALKKGGFPAQEKPSPIQ